MDAKLVYFPPRVIVHIIESKSKFYRACVALHCLLGTHFSHPLSFRSFVRLLWKRGPSPSRFFDFSCLGLWIYVWIMVWMDKINFVYVVCFYLFVVFPHDFARLI